MQPSLAKASRTVVKIGSALLADPETGALNEAWLDGLARDVAQLRERGKDALIVSSGRNRHRAAAPRARARRAEAGGDAGGGGLRADQAGACVSVGARPPTASASRKSS